jgi:hypothetical protein
VAIQTIFLFNLTGSHHQNRFERSVFNKKLIPGTGRGLYQIDVAAAAIDFGLFQHLVVYECAICRFDSLTWQLVAIFAPGTVLVELHVGKMAEVAGGLAHLKMVFLSLMLVTVNAIKLKTRDQFIVIHMGLVPEGHTIRELDLFGHELLTSSPVTCRGRTALVYDRRPGLHYPATDLYERKMGRGFLGDMRTGRQGFASHHLTFFIGGRGWIMTLYATDFLMLALPP